MAPIDDAIAAIKAHDPAESFVLRVYADQFGVNRSTLGRRLRGVTQSHQAKAASQLKLHPNHEAWLLLEL
jgi:AraC-like DNA-binding protein